MNLWLPLWFFVALSNVHTISIELISYAALTLSPFSSSFTMNGTSQECLCAMVTSTNITALNYFTNHTCQLFSNASLTNTPFSLTINLNSQLYFLYLPSSAVTSASATSTASNNVSTSSTSVASCAAVSVPLTGITVFGNTNGTAGSSLSTLNAPWGITVNTDKSILITDTSNSRVLRVAANASTGVVVASANSDYCLMRRYQNGSLTSSIVFGSTCGTNLTQFGSSASFTMDSTVNFYVADNFNHRIMFWGANNTTGTLLAGTTGVLGSDTLHLNHPQDIVVDETHGFFYVADSFNHRILRFSSGSYNGTVVAGGNGPGLQPNQLNGPCGLYLTKNSSILYIADTSNNRIVRWCLGDSVGLTVAGDSNGTAGVTALLLSVPTTVTMDNDETHLYVSDKQNNRIQRFTLV